MVYQILFSLIGFYILIKGANFLVEGASSIARRFKISNLVIGLVIAGIGTSIPEFSITFIANLIGETEIGLGAIIGSNTFNILFILGLTALIFSLKLQPVWVQRDLLWNIIAVFITISFAISGGELDRLEGLAMLLIFSFWLYTIVKNSNEENIDTASGSFRELTFPLAVVLTVAGLAGVILGGKWVVDGAAVLTGMLGISGTLIGLTLVGLGTSIPEILVTIVAAYKDQPGIALGNIIGSNIFDFLMILGFGALVKPIPATLSILPDAVVTMLAASLLYGFMFVGENYVLKRWQGLVMVFLYLIYLGFILGRG